MSEAILLGLEVLWSPGGLSPLPAFIRKPPHMGTGPPTRAESFGLLPELMYKSTLTGAGLISSLKQPGFLQGSRAPRDLSRRGIPTMTRELRAPEGSFCQ